MVTQLHMEIPISYRHVVRRNVLNHIRDGVNAAPSKWSIFGERKFDWGGQRWTSSVRHFQAEIFRIVPRDGIAVGRREGSHVRV